MRREQRKWGERPINANPGTSLVVQWLRPYLPMQGVWVQSLFRELRSHISCSQKTKTENKQYCNKFYKSKTINKMAIETYISTITLNVNNLNAPTKRQTS